MNKPINLLVVLITVLLTQTSCIRSIAQKNLTVEKGAIPPDFGRDSSTLLVIKSGKNSYDKYLNKNFKAYEGLYQMVNRNEINTLYQDSIKFRYVFDYNLENKYVSGSSSGMNVRKFLVYDRITDRNYKAPLTSSFFSKIMKAYIHNLNKAIENNK